MANHEKFINILLELSEKLLPEIRSKEKRLSLISGEKVSTVKNWLFHNKIPVSTKRLTLSDRFGISEESLFSNNQEISIPVSVYSNELKCYVVPQIDETDINKMLHNEPPLPAIDRIPLKLNSLECYGTPGLYNTYCIKVVRLSFPPFISPDDFIFINPSVPYKNNTFCIYKTPTNIEIVKIKTTKNEHVTYNKLGNECIANKNSSIIPILFVLSGRYWNEY
jgi:hypothetical protein